MSERDPYGSAAFTSLKKTRWTIGGDESSRRKRLNKGTLMRFCAGGEDLKEGTSVGCEESAQWI